MISDSLDEIYDILDAAHHDHVPVFLGILHALVASMESWEKSEGGTKLADKVDIAGNDKVEDHSDGDTNEPCRLS